MERAANESSSGCPSVQTLLRFLRGELSEEESSRVDTHLSDCAACEDRVRSAAGDDEPPAAFLALQRPFETGPDEDAAILSASNLDFRERIGQGGMGVVYRVHDQALERDLALKTLHPRFAKSPQSLRRFREEMLTTARLQHPGIVSIHASGKLADERPYYLMPIIQGRTLASLLEGRGEGPASRFLQIFASVCHAVGYAHAQGIVHRDLKPANIMVGDFGEVQIVDWGLARRANATSADAAESTSHAALAPPGESVGTRTVGPVGTYAYMPPEQASNDAGKVGCAADVFALGAILVEILTGAPIYASRDRAELRDAALRGNVDDAIRRLHGQGVAEDLIGLCVRCLATDPSRRPADASIVGHAVRDHLDALEDRARRAETERRVLETRMEEQRKRRRFARMAALALGAALVLGLAGTSVGLLQARSATEAAVAARNQADARANESEAILGFVERKVLGAGQLNNAGGFVGGDERLSVLLQRAAPEIAVEFAKHPAVEARVRHSIGGTFLRLGDHQAAKPMFQRAADLSAGLYGAESPLTLRSQGAAGVCAYALGDPEAVKVVERTFEAQRALSDRWDDDTLRCGMALASIVLREGDANRSESLAESVLNARTTQFGPEHEDTLDTLCFLGMLHRSCGRHDKSLAMHERLLDRCKKRFGARDPNTLTARHFVALNYAMMERNRDGIALCRETLALQTATLGETHFDTLRSHTLLLGLFEQAGLPDEAKAHIAALPDYRNADFGTQPEVGIGCLRICLNVARAIGAVEKQAELEAAIARGEASRTKKKAK